jgi:uncharacterized protein YsxB (DUF464 family)
MKHTALGLVLCAVLCAALSAALPCTANALERVAFQKPLVSSDQAALTENIAELFDQAAAVIARLYGGTLGTLPMDAASSAGQPDYTLSTIASKENGSSSA